jgi:hypothetical protein
MTLARNAHRWIAWIATLLLLAAAPQARGVDEASLLPVDQAFALAAAAPQRDRIELQWKIAPGYYLYRHRISVQVEGGGFAAQPVQLPRGDRVEQRLRRRRHRPAPCRQPLELHPGEQRELPQVVHAGLSALRFPVADGAALHPELDRQLGLRQPRAAARDTDAVGGCARCLEVLAHGRPPVRKGGGASYNSDDTENSLQWSKFDSLTAGGRARTWRRDWVSGEQASKNSIFPDGGLFPSRACAEMLSSTTWMSVSTATVERQAAGPGLFGRPPPAASNPGAHSPLECAPFFFARRHP